MLNFDRACIQVGRISGFGLLEMSRQRLRPGMLEATTQPCPHCHGTGLLRSDDNVALGILRQIEEEGVRGKSREVLVKCPVTIANYLMNQKREHIAGIEARYGLAVRIEGDPALIPPDYAIEKFKTATRAVAAATVPVISSDMGAVEDEEEVIEAEVEAATDEDNAERPKKRRRRRRRRKGNGGAEGDAQIEAGSEPTTGSEADAATEAGDETSTEAQTEAPAEAEETTEAQAPEEAGEAAPKKRSRSRTRSRKKPAAEDAAEVTVDESAPVTEAAADQADPAEAAAEPAEKVEETPKKPRRRSPKSRKTDAPAEPASDDRPAAEETTPAEVAAADASVGNDGPDAPEVEAAPAEAVAAELVASPAPDVVEASDGPFPESPQPEPVTADAEPADPAKPKRRGWWNISR